jgi:hypothetical protein
MLVEKTYVSVLTRKIFGWGIAFLLSVQVATAQLEQASPPIADPSDARFQGVKEDWTTPALKGSNLESVPPIVGYVNTHPGYTEELIQVQWRFGDPIDLYVIKPKGIRKPPVILYQFGFPGDTERFKDDTFQRGAIQGGFAAVGFVPALTGHRYHDRPMKEWFISELQECLATSAHDVQMVLNYLDTRGDLDMNRVGMFSVGSGASIGILSSSVDRRIKVLDALDPWGDWPQWMAASPLVPEDERAEYLKPEFLKKVTGLDPMDWLPKVRAERFRLQDAIFEPTTPKLAKEKLRAAASASAIVTVYATPEELNAIVSKHDELGWIKSELSLPAGRLPRSTPASARSSCR